LLTDLLKNTLPDDDDYAALTGMTLLDHIALTTYVDA